MLSVILKILMLASENIQTPENMNNLWDLITKPFTGLFPDPALFWVIMLSVTEIGLYMKTQSVGAVTASLAIASLLLANLVSTSFSWVFSIMAGVAFTFLLYWLAKSRGY
jgi:Na+/phosphate symporter